MNPPGHSKSTTLCMSRISLLPTMCGRSQAKLSRSRVHCLTMLKQRGKVVRRHVDAVHKRDVVLPLPQSQKATTSSSKDIYSPDVPAPPPLAPPPAPTPRGGGGSAEPLWLRPCFTIICVLCAKISLLIVSCKSKSVTSAVADTGGFVRVRTNPGADLGGSTRFVRAPPSTS